MGKISSAVIIYKMGHISIRAASSRLKVHLRQIKYLLHQIQKHKKYIEEAD